MYHMCLFLFLQGGVYVYYGMQNGHLSTEPGLTIDCYVSSIVLESILHSI